MIIHPDFAGIDISKLYLDVFDGRFGKVERFDNTPVTACKLAKRFAKQNTFVFFEATGRYDRLLREAFADVELRFARVKPARARDFAKATGRLAKTDAIDARMLAAMAQTLSPESFRRPAPERQNLSDLQLRRNQLVSMRAEEMTRLEALTNTFIVRGIQAHIKTLSKAIEAIDDKIKTLFAAHEELHEAELQLRSTPGIGPVASAVFISFLPELGHCSPQQIAALAGLAPFNADSGSIRGKRRIRGGRSRVRNALYMAAISAIRSKSKFGHHYRKLIALGKPAKVALIAVARKILITANAIVRDNKKYAV